MRTQLAEGLAGRRVVISELADRRWRATAGGVALTATHVGWAQAFDVPAAGGDLVITFDRSHRRHMLLLQGILVFAAVLLALPARRRPEELDDDLPAEPLLVSA
jgi:hypothetical protein